MDALGYRVLFLDSYTVSHPGAGAAPSSDSIGYGITASDAIRSGLISLGMQLSRPLIDAGDESVTAQGRRSAWILGNYHTVLRSLLNDPPDAIFCFHIMMASPVEIRRMALDLGLSVPIMGYTHGSHWDPTDTFRHEAYPGLDLLDLANLDVVDRLLVVSEYMRTTLQNNISAFNSDVAQRIDAKVVVVGLPLDVDRIDRCRTDREFPRPTVVFNHAPVASKNPELFVQVMTRVLPRHDVNVLFTREFAPYQAGGKAVAELASQFPDQVILGRDMPLDDYYAALWASELQVSTASHESLGVATLEAMYATNCCILPRLGSYPEICENHPDVLYDLGPGPLEERLCYFLEHEKERRAVAMQLRVMASKYQPSIVIPKIARSLVAAIDSRDHGHGR